MYIAMNRFMIAEDDAAAFEKLWFGREGHLHRMEGVVEFHMLKGQEREDGTLLYASHTVWGSEETFLCWTKSGAFRAAHRDAGQTRKLH